jgi:hypothetical protein
LIEIEYRKFLKGIRTAQSLRTLGLCSGEEKEASPSQ